MLTNLTRSYQINSKLSESKSTGGRITPLSDFHNISNFEEYRQGFLKPLDKQEIAGSMHELRQLLSSLKDINKDQTIFDDVLNGRDYGKEQQLKGNSQEEEKIRRNEVGKLLGNIQEYLSTNLKEISDIRRQVVPVEMKDEKNSSDEEWERHLNNINIFGNGSSHEKVSFLKGLRKLVYDLKK